MTDPYGPWEHDVDVRHHDAPGRRSMRAVVADLVWRYRSARLGTQITIDVLAACLVMAIVVAGALVLDRDPGPSVTSTAGPRATVAHGAPTTTTTAAPTTAAPTTSAPTTTTAPPAPPTTRVPRTTTTLAAPPTEPPATDSSAGPPPRSSTERDDDRGRPYRDCMEAWLARDLPLFAGEPGYSPELDRDGDGEACEWGERDEEDERD